MVCLLSVQLNCFQIAKIYYLAHNEKTVQYSKSENEEVNKKLMELIRRHQETIQMNTHMVELFMINVFSHFVSAALTLCCVSVNLLLVSVENFFFYLIV